MAQQRKRIPNKKVFVNPNKLSKGCVIGSTVLPSAEDPSLKNGVALTVLHAYDQKYVKYEDIDAAEDSSYRYWRDVYLIVAWNDPQYDQLNIGDCVFALFENPDKTLTTIYFGAKIKQLNPLFIDYDEDGDHSNISIRPYTDIKTKAGNVRVPTVIRRMHAEHTPQHVEAIKKYVKRSRKHQADGDSEPKRKKRKIKKKKDDSKCCVCMEKKKEYAVQPCGHLCICGGCKEQIESATNSCPICRANADSYQKIYY